MPVGKSKTAPSGRSYRTYQENAGIEYVAEKALFPDSYVRDSAESSTWLCTIRECAFVCEGLNQLDKHFDSLTVSSAPHRQMVHNEHEGLFWDNLDGSLTYMRNSAFDSNHSDDPPIQAEATATEGLGLVYPRIRTPSVEPLSPAPEEDVPGEGGIPASPPDGPETPGSANRPRRAAAVRSEERTRLVVARDLQSSSDEAEEDASSNNMTASEARERGIRRTLPHTLLRWSPSIKRRPREDLADRAITPPPLPLSPPPTGGLYRPLTRRSSNSSSGGGGGGTATSWFAPASPTSPPGKFELASSPAYRGKRRGS